MDTQNGYVILQGIKIFVTVRKVKASHYVTAHTGSQPVTERLEVIEKKLKKVSGAKGKLLEGKALPV